MADHLGTFNASSTVHLYFTTHATDGAPVAPSSAFEAADLLIYKNGSATQRSSANGITMTSPFDSVTGLHCVAIDLSDNTDASFYAAGSEYVVILNADETVDSVAVTKVLAYFSIERVAKVNVTQIGGDAQSATDLKDFADAGYDPSSNKVQGVVLVDTCTTNSDMRGTDSAYTGTPPTAGAIADAVWDEATSGHTTSGTFGEQVKTDIDAILVDTAEIGAAGDGLTALASAANLSTLTGYVDTEVAAIKAKTDNLPASPAATGDIPAASAIADAVWDEAISGHSAGGSTGEALSAAGGAGNPWITALPGSYTSGQAGYILGTFLDATVSSRATIAGMAIGTGGGVAGQTTLTGVSTQITTLSGKVDTIDGIVDDILADTGTDGVKLDLTQAVPTSNTAQTVGDTLNAARAQGFGKWVKSGTTLTLYANDGTTTVKSFTLDDADEPTSRTPA